MVCPYNKTSYPASRRAPTRSSSYLGGESWAARSLDYLLLHGCRLACIRTLRGDPYAHDDSIVAICSQFDVESWAEAAIGHLHHPRLGVCGGDTCCSHLGAQDSRFSAPLAVLRSLRLRQVPQRLFDSLLPLSCCTLSRCPLPVRHSTVRLLTLLRQPFHLCPGSLKALVQPLLATKGCRPGARSHSHPVLSHSLHADEPCSHQRGYDLGQQVVQRLLVPYSKVRQHVVVDRHAAPHPTVGIVLVTQPRQPSSAAYAFHCGQQHLRIRRRATRTVRYCFDVPIKSRQVQLVQEPPNSTGRMISSSFRVESQEVV